MQKKILGTDDVRGHAKSWPITPYMVPRPRRPAGRHFIGAGRSCAVVIGQHRRLSGHMAQGALIGRSTPAGMDAVPTGPFPTPAIGMLARSRRGDVGVMIRASHNPRRGNGGKLPGIDEQGHLIDDKGRIVDGEQFVALVAKRARSQGKLARDTLVATILSSSGPDRHLTGHGICKTRRWAGIRYDEPVRTMGFTVGGGQSGHIIQSKIRTTGDGLGAALREADCPASEVLSRFEPLPQVACIVSAPRGSTVLEQPQGIDVVDRMTRRPGDTGGLLVQPSGSEALVRIMAKGESPDLPAKITHEIGPVLNTGPHRDADLSPHPSVVAAGAAFASTALQPALVQRA